MGLEPMVSALPMRCFTAKLRQRGPDRIRFRRRTYLPKPAKNFGHELTPSRSAW